MTFTPPLRTHSEADEALRVAFESAGCHRPTPLSLEWLVDHLKLEREEDR